MADSLLSPAVGGAIWAATGVTMAVSARSVARESDDRKVPLMGVLGAFIFAAQMVNFTIPGTGSSGHLGGGTILAVLLGPGAAFLVIASVLTVQALFFADGGLLALGANVFNLGFFPAFVAYPLVFRPLAGRSPTAGRLALASVAAAVVGLQLGAFGVVLETVLSGIAALPFSTFLLLMQPLHLAIGVVEGLVTAAVISFVWKARPEVMAHAALRPPPGRLPLGRLLGGLGVAAALAGGLLSWFASAKPDGLEWSLRRLGGGERPEARRPLHESLGALQQKTALLPDYGFRKSGPETNAAPSSVAWPAPDAGTSASGIVGGLLTLLLAAAVGLALRRRGTPRGAGSGG